MEEQGHAVARGAGADLAVEVDLSARPTVTDLHDPEQRARAERALSAIPGVLAARLVPGYERNIDELHVLTGLDRSPKQTVRDVQTLLMARFGVSTDHRVISVVQLDEGHGLPVSSRVSIERIATSASGRSSHAEVVLRDVDLTATGSVDGSATPSGRARAVATATLQAVAELLQDGPELELDGVELVTIASHQVAVATVQVVDARSSTTLTGSALVRDASADAIARAVLDALNRVLSESAR